MRAPVLVLALLVTLLGLTACSADGETTGPTAEQVAQTKDDALAAWRADVEAELGTATYDFAALQQDAAADCLRTSAADWTVELALSGDTSTSALTRIGLAHGCADVVAAFDEAVTTVEEAVDPLDLVCGPGVELSDEAALHAELVCAHR